jgi:hypothetical protein
MELLAKLTDGTPVKLTLEEYCFNGAHKNWLITKIEPVKEEKKQDPPQWLTEQMKFDVRNIWNAHEIPDDGKRSDAVKYLKDQAQKVFCNITISEAFKIIQDFCL